MTKKLIQKLKYLENEESSKDEIKSTFYHFQRAFIEANKTIFLKGKSLTLTLLPLNEDDNEEIYPKEPRRHLVRPWPYE